MNKVSESALLAIKKVLDTAIRKGGIFSSTEQVIDAINAYNYIAKVLSETNQEANSNKQ